MNDHPQRKTLKPSELRKILHPEESSIQNAENLTLKEEQPRLSESEVEFLLERLPEKNAHHEFERLAVCLCEIEVCRNIKPATGPVGGGDYGEDASTHPVSEDVRNAYFWVGVGTTSIGDDWLFAFSIKKKWKTKIQEDAEKAAKRNPVPKKFLFVTSQPIKIKKREDVKKDLKAQFGFDAEILDRTWIVHQIVYKGHWRLAAEFLDAPQALRGIEKSNADQKNMAPTMPSELSNRISTLRDKVAYRTSYLYISHRAEDLLELADLLKESDRASSERAYREAIEDAMASGFEYLLHRAIYNYFWTSLWYWDDVSNAMPHLDQFFKLIQKMNLPEPLERGFNIWACLYGASYQDFVNKQDALLESREKILIDACERIVHDKDRPTSSLMTQEMLFWHHVIIESTTTGAVSDKTVNELRSIVKQAGQISLFPLRRLVNRLFKDDSLLKKNPKFEKVLDTIQTAIGKREGDLAEAEFAFNKALMYFDQGAYQKALKELAKTKDKGISRETLYETLRNLMAAADCYIKLGFYLAAKGELVAAYHLATLYENKTYKSEALLALRALNNIEIHRGRVRLALWWLQLHDMFCNHWRADKEMLGPRGVQFAGETDSYISCLLVWAFKSNKNIFNSIYPIADYLQMPLSCIFSEALLSGIEAGKKKTRQLDWEDMWPKLLEPLNKALSPEFNFENMDYICDENTTYVHEEFTIAGINFRFKVRNDYLCHLLAETLGSAIQAFFINARLENLAIIEDEIEVEFDTDTFNSEEIQLYDGNKGQSIYKIYKISQVSYDGLFANKERYGINGIKWIEVQLLHLLFEICIDPIDELKGEIDWMYKEGAFHRAFAMGPLFQYLQIHCKKEVYDGTSWRSTTS